MSLLLRTLVSPTRSLTPHPLITSFFLCNRRSFNISRIRPPDPMEKPDNYLEGLMAINKPSGISSGEAIRNLITLFTESSIFAATMDFEKRKREIEDNKHQHHQRRNRRKIWRAEVKMGHGGTLDPMAEGVLVLGIGGGTKLLQNYLNGTKTYETTALFGCSTDSYDAMGSVVRRAGWEDLDRQKVEKEMEKFRGNIMQKPPLFSALNHQGKRYYEYAREGKPLPVEIQARPVATESLDLLEFTTEHEYKFPTKEVDAELKKEAAALEGKVEVEAKVEEGEAKTGEKRSRSPEAESDETAAKKIKTEPEPNTSKDSSSSNPPPIAKIRMAVTKGFYVRSFIYDLGEACGSLAHMVKLVRTQQGQWELGKNVFEWDEFMGPDATEEVWGPKVVKGLTEWEKRLEKKEIFKRQETGA